MVVRLVSGVDKVDGNEKEKTITVRFNPDVASVDIIKAAMARSGFEGQER